MNKLERNAVIVFVVPLLLACGTFEIGIEQTPTPILKIEMDTPTLTPTLLVLVTPNPTLTSTAIVAATATFVPPTRERITFASGSSNYTFSTSLTRGVPKMYVLTILAQQQLIVDADGDVTIVVLDSQNRTVIPVSARPGHWVGVIPQKGDFTILLNGEGTFNLTINIPPLG